MFENSLKLVEDCGLTWLHVFPFSAREGTPAARIPPVNGQIVKARAAKLRALGQARVAGYLAAQVGREAQVLIENPHMGRTEGFAEVAFAAPQPVGQIVAAQLTGVKDGRLAGVPR